MESSRVDKVHDIIKSGKTFDEAWKEAGFIPGGGRIRRLRKQLRKQYPGIFDPTSDNLQARIDNAKTKDAIDETIVELGGLMASALTKRKKIK